jgi:hypothetical protein
VAQAARTIDDANTPIFQALEETERRQVLGPSALVPTRIGSDDAQILLIEPVVGPPAREELSNDRGCVVASGWTTPGLDHSVVLDGEVTDPADQDLMPPPCGRADEQRRGLLDGGLPPMVDDEADPHQGLFSKTGGAEPRR